jgi:hypothetical protein
VAGVVAGVAGAWSVRWGVAVCSSRWDVSLFGGGVHVAWRGERDGAPGRPLEVVGLGHRPPLTRLMWWPYWAGRPSTFGAGVMVGLPLWPLAAVGAGAGWGLWRAGAARRRRARGVCTGCGYPREGLGSGAACPECGGAA